MKTNFILFSLFLVPHLAHGVDLNSNGLDDVYELQFPEVASVDPSLDSDGDGFSNLAEGEALTNPSDPADCFKCLPLVEDSDNYTVKWPSKVGLTYQVQHSSDGTTWTEVGATSTGTGDVLSVQVAKDSLPETDGDFFRVNVAGAIDGDDDGVADWAESLLGFDPTRSASVRSASAGGDMQHLKNLLTGANPSGGLAGTSLAGVPSDENASRFLAQATFGPRLDDINNLQALGDNAFEKWIDRQMTLRASYLVPYTNYLYSIYYADYQAIQAGTLRTADLPYSYVGNPNYVNAGNSVSPWMRNAINAPDQLRQRVGWGLSQIYVISRASALTSSMRAFTDFHDHLLEHSFGNFEDLLEGVARHPAMGIYLSHIFNRKADPSVNRYPDENFAREIMQLFSIGLYELNLDGTIRMDSSGNQLETYDNEDIQELARIFTGMMIQGKTFGSVGIGSTDMFTDMVWDLSEKDMAPKTFLKVRDLSFAESESGYTLSWPSHARFHYMPQYLDDSGAWQNTEAVLSAGDQVTTAAISHATAGTGLGAENFRVKHHIDLTLAQLGDAENLVFDETSSQYRLTWYSEEGVSYAIRYRPLGQSDFVDLFTVTPSSSGSYARGINKSFLGSGYTAEDFIVIPTSASSPQYELNLLIEILTKHPNTGPFMAKHLIKHLVMSSPSPEYIARVASVFQDNGAGGAGDLGATVKAVLLDPEARGSEYLVNERFGKLKEPMLRLTMMARAFEAGRDDSYVADPVNPADHFKYIQWWSQRPTEDFLQMPFEAPTVFNFYEPDYSHPGTLANAGLESPEFQILTPVTATTVPNQLYLRANGRDYHGRSSGGEPAFANDYSREEGLAAQTDLLLDRLNVLLSHGQMSAQSRKIIAEGIDAEPPVDPSRINFRARQGAYLTVISPNSAVIK